MDINPIQAFLDTVLAFFIGMGVGVAITYVIVLFGSKINKDK